MSEGPERIYISAYKFLCPPTERKNEDEIEYIRADLAKELVRTEPEYPGDLPQELNDLLMKALVNKDLDLLVRAMRASVRLTKENILTALSALKGEGGE